jgi:serine/threonine-protein kinase HipA
MAICRICLREVGKDSDCHPACIEALFGATQMPALDVDLTKLYSLAATKMAGKMSISGVQEKVSLTLAADGSALEVASSGGRYILKPESSRFLAVPPNEHLTMHLAALVAIEVPPFGLLRLKDGSWAYVIKRFDRLDDGGKLALEDFCQLSQKPLRDKYDGTAELCVRLLRKFASEPLIEIHKLYRLLLFTWWVANGDMHLKNFSLLTTRNGIRRLSPAYDLVCTKLVIPDDALSLTIGGRDKKLTRRRWLDFATYCRLPERAAKRVLSEQIDALAGALGYIERSFLPEAMKERYAEIVRENTSVLAG